MCGALVRFYFLSAPQEAKSGEGSGDGEKEGGIRYAPTIRLAAVGVEEEARYAL